MADDFIRSWEDGTADIAGLTNLAKGYMRKFYDARPEFAPEWYQSEAPAMSSAIKEVFG